MKIQISSGFVVSSLDIGGSKIICGRLSIYVPVIILILFWELPQSADSSTSVSISYSPVSADSVSKAGSAVSFEKSVSFVSLISSDPDGCSVS